MENHPFAIKSIYLHQFYDRKQIDKTACRQIELEKNSKSATNKYLSRNRACNDLITFLRAAVVAEAAAARRRKRFSRIYVFVNFVARERDRFENLGRGE